MIDPQHPTPRPLPLRSSPAITAVPRLHSPPAGVFEAVASDGGAAGLQARLRMAGVTADAPREEPTDTGSPLSPPEPFPSTDGRAPSGVGGQLVLTRSELLLPTPIAVGVARLFELEEHLGQLPGVQRVEVSVRDDGRVLVRVDGTPGAEHGVRLYLALTADALEREHRRL
jgi:hypothetical protein